jgi:methyl coenzyme M reductase subunit C-like uncharacterized protein (methanogenesis marker protein 7)
MSESADVSQNTAGRETIQLVMSPATKKPAFKPKTVEAAVVKKKGVVQSTGQKALKVPSPLTLQVDMISRASAITPSIATHANQT